ncbi:MULTISPECIES: mechanosensitive ion channel domain-containing protein [unclassified Zunongwangia]|uniref:mechanosensitive ion channel domain-containing protein n=1 Tax=unclassified Zunongwangia TaxID=2632541 RepID=UPI0022DD6AD0|nr:MULTISPECIES: mechanosensitive ion channel domain-containing protein [unclassified Zunongwangia]WBL23645.1 mechanosensitive ion channel [Zunongwangia sp. HRR-M8]WBL24411.1 mechanosensitive ion channel [Zunongwangia sp. HGR-M22]
MKILEIAYSSQLIYTGLMVVLLLVINLILKKTAQRIGNKGEIHITRIRLMFRYINILIVILAVFLMALVWGMDLRDLALVFSSVFAVLGVALFAIWSILSNITSGIIMFFNFPYKIGDKIKIHDKDMPIEAVIEDIKAFHLHLRTDDGELITYPNNLILQKAVSLIQKDVFLDEGKNAL